MHKSSIMVSAQGGAGIALDTDTTGTLNIGAAAGQPATMPGTLDAPMVLFGYGSGGIVFNHLDTSGTYRFAPVIEGQGRVDVYQGNTVLTGQSTYSGSHHHPWRYNNGRWR